MDSGYKGNGLTASLWQAYLMLRSCPTQLGRWRENSAGVWRRLSLSFQGVVFGVHDSIRIPVPSSDPETIFHQIKNRPIHIYIMRCPFQPTFVLMMMLINSLRVCGSTIIDDMNIWVDVSVRSKNLRYINGSIRNGDYKTGYPRCKYSSMTRWSC